MTDQPPCPRCGCTVSDSGTYFFIPADNLRWHGLCYRTNHPEKFEDQPKEEIQ